MYEQPDSIPISIASFTFLFATSRSFPGFAANRRRERRGRSAYYIALFFCLLFWRHQFLSNCSKQREEKKSQKRARERERIRIRRCVRLPTERFRRDRSIDRSTTTTTRRSRRRPARYDEKKKKERKKRQLLCCCFTPKSSTKKNDVSQGVLRRCSTRKRRDARTQIFSLAHFAAARCGLSLFTSWYARFTSSYFLSNASFFFVAVMSKNEFFKKEKKGEVFI